MNESHSHIHSRTPPPAEVHDLSTVVCRGLEALTDLSEDSEREDSWRIYNNPDLERKSLFLLGPFLESHLRPQKEGSTGFP